MVEPESEILGIKYLIEKRRRRIYVTLRCKNGHIESRLFDNIVKGHGCAACKANTLSVKNREYSKEYVAGFIDGLGYDWLNSDQYQNASSIIEYKCRVCGHVGRANFTALKNGRRCRGCSIYKKKDTDEYRKYVSDTTNGEYVLIGKYVTCKDKTSFRHNECGRIFEMTPDDFSRGNRCPFCLESHGEKAIASALDNAGIAYQREYRFADCRNKRPLPFDFYLPDYNVVIEFQGEQHYRPVDFWGGKEAFEYRKRNDFIKADYCKSNNIPLISIPFWDDKRIGGIAYAVREISGRE